MPRPHKSTHAIFHFDDDSTLYYTDIRQFGRIHVVPSGEIPDFLGRRKLGVEPLTDDFQPAILENAASRRPRSKVKALLLDQRVVAGIGISMPTRASIGPGCTRRSRWQRSPTSHLAGCDSLSSKCCETL